MCLAEESLSAISRLPQKNITAFMARLHPSIMKGMVGAKVASVPCEVSGLQKLNKGSWHQTYGQGLQPFYIQLNSPFPYPTSVRILCNRPPSVHWRRERLPILPTTDNTSGAFRLDDKQHEPQGFQGPFRWIKGSQDDVHSWEGVRNSQNHKLQVVCWGWKMSTS